MWTGAAIVENSLAVSQVHIELSYDLAVSLIGTYHKEPKEDSGTHTAVFMALLFTSAKRQKEPKCPYRDGRISSMLCTWIWIRVVEGTEMLMHAIVWMNLKQVCLREIIQILPGST